MGDRASWRAGVTDVWPILVGALPFAVIAGVAAVDAGLTRTEAIAASFVIFAGASQLAAYDLIRQDAAIILIVGTALIINARFLMYSAALTEHFRHVPLHRKAAAAYVMTDQAFTISALRFDRDPPASKLSYYMGAGLAMWAVWQSGTIAGVIAGAELPDGLSLDFAVPLVFIALVVPAIRDRADGTAALVAGIVAVLAASMPNNTGLLIAAAAGISVGLAAGRSR